MPREATSSRSQRKGIGPSIYGEGVRVSSGAPFRDGLLRLKLRSPDASSRVASADRRVSQLQRVCDNALSALSQLRIASHRLLEKQRNQEAAASDLTPSPLRNDHEFSPRRARRFKLDDSGNRVDVFWGLGIPPNYAVPAGLVPGKDSIAIESPVDNPYNNFIAVRAQGQGCSQGTKLVHAYQNDTIRQLIKDKLPGQIPAF